MGALVRTFTRLLMPIILAGLPEEAFAGLVGIADGFGKDDMNDAAVAARAPVIRHREWLGLNEFRQKLRAMFRDFFSG